MKRKKFKDLTQEEREELFKPLLPAIQSMGQTVKKFTALSQGIERIANMANFPGVQKVAQSFEQMTQKFTDINAAVQSWVEAANNAEKFFEEMGSLKFKEFVNMPPVDRQTVLAIIEDVTDPESPHAETVRKLIDEAKKAG
ncbi:hypothetical protein LJC19_08225, partial [Oxalobacter sp. OttesenSCG-928-P03]|nr:hypothetical protein [Oxalobacter sp. OttesenSCG-928-P03]